MRNTALPFCGNTALCAAGLSDAFRHVFATGTAVAVDGTAGQSDRQQSGDRCCQYHGGDAADGGRPRRQQGLFLLRLRRRRRIRADKTPSVDPSSVIQVSSLSPTSVTGNVTIDGHTAYANALVNGQTINIPTLVRTGTGSITIAAAGNDRTARPGSAGRGLYRRGRHGHSRGF